MNPKAAVEQLLHLLIPRRPDVPAEILKRRMLFTAKLFKSAIRHCRLFECHSGLDRFFPSVNKDHDLMSLFDQFRDFLVGNFIEVSPRLRATRFPFDANEMLFKRDWPERRIKIEQATMSIDATSTQFSGTQLVIGV